MGHPNLPPAGCCSWGSPRATRAGGTPQAVREANGVGTPTSRAIPTSGCSSVAQGCSQPRTRSQPKRPPGPSSSRSGPALPPPVPTPGAGGGFGARAALSPQLRRCSPSPALPPALPGPSRGGQTRRLQQNRTAPRGEGAAGKRLPRPAGHRRHLPVPARPLPRLRPGRQRSEPAGVPRPRCGDSPDPRCPWGPSRTAPRRGGHRLLPCSPDTAPSSHFASSPGGRPGDPPGSRCSRSCSPTPAAASGRP